MLSCDQLKELVPGVFLFPAGLNFWEQKALIRLYQKNKHEMYVPRLRSGHNMNLQMNCFGQHWSAIDYKYHTSRIDVDHKEVKTVHPLLISLAQKFNSYCFPEHAADWDIALCNYYGVNSTLGLHQDNSESAIQLKTGHPVVSFSIGASCEFILGGLTRKSPAQKFCLNSGDVLIFGGVSRLRYHGVGRIYSQSQHSESRIPFSKSLDHGRLNFTLRKY